MPINLRRATPLRTPWWKLLLLVLASACINYVLVIFFQYVRVYQPAWAAPLTQLSAEYNSNYKRPPFPYTPSELFNKWDTFYYLDIAQNGYKQAPFSNVKRENWAFFPLYPLSLRLFALVGLSMDGLVIAGLLFSNVFFFLALIAWRNLFENMNVPIKHWHLFLALLVLFPLGYIYNFVFTESLFLWLSGLFFLRLEKHEYVWAAWLVGLLAVTRITGLIFLPVLLFAVWNNHTRIKSTTMQVTHVIGLSIVSLTPLFLFLTYLGALTGEPLAPLRIQAAWDNAGFVPFKTFLGYLTDYGLMLYWPHVLSILLLIGCWLIVSKRAWYLLKREKPWGQLEWSLIIASLALVFVNSSLNNRNSIFRYTTTIPYAYLLASVWLSKQQQLHFLKNGTLVVFAGLHLIFLAFFVLQIPMYGF